MGSSCTEQDALAQSAAATPALWPSIIHVGSTRMLLKATCEAERHTGTRRFTHSVRFGVRLRKGTWCGCPYFVPAICTGKIVPSLIQPPSAPATRWQSCESIGKELMPTL